MRYEKALRGIELLKKPEWNSVKGIYNEYGLERTFCGCGYVTDKRVFVCPNCGNTSFMETKDYQGHLMHVDGDKLVFQCDKDDETLSVSRTWLKAHRDPTDPAYMLLSEEPVKTVCFSTQNRWVGRDVDDSVIINGIRENLKHFSSDFQWLIKLMDELDMNLSQSPGFFASTGKTCVAFRLIVNELMANGEKNLLTAIMVNHRGEWESLKEELLKLGLPSFLNPYRDNPTVLGLVKTFSRHWDIKNQVRIVEANFNKLPLDVQNVLLLYLRQGLITIADIQNMNLVDETLLREHPDVQAKILKKYFANFGSASGPYRWNSKQVSIKEMREYYENHGLPICSETFDLRSYFAMVNGDIVREKGFDPVKTEELLEKMEEAPLDTFLEIGNLRRPRKKKTP